MVVVLLGVVSSFTYFEIRVVASQCSPFILCFKISMHIYYIPRVKFTFIPIGSRWIQNADGVPDIPLGENVRTKIQQFSLMNKFKKKVIRVNFFDYFTFF